MPMVLPWIPSLMTCTNPAPNTTEQKLS